MNQALVPDPLGARGPAIRDYVVLGLVFAGLAGACGRVGFDARAADEVDAAPSVDADTSSPTVIATGRFPFRLAASDEALYWADFFTGEVHRISLATWESEELLAPRISDANVYGLALVGDTLIVCDSATGALHTLPAQGGTPSVLQTGGCFDVDADDTHLYWTNDLAEAPAVSRAPRSGGASEALTPNASANNLSLQNGSLYWTSYDDGEVYRMSIAEGDRALLAEVTLAGPWGLTVDGSYVYFVEHQPAAGAVWRIPIAGGPPESLAEGQRGAHQIVVDGDTVYWASEDDGTIMKKAGGADAEVVASGLQAPLGIAVAGSYLFWTTRAGEVWRAPK